LATQISEQSILQRLHYSTIRQYLGARRKRPAGRAPRNPNMSELRAAQWRESNHDMVSSNASKNALRSQDLQEMDSPPPTAEVFFDISDGRQEIDVRISRPDTLKRRSLGVRSLMEAAKSQGERIPVRLDPESEVDSYAAQWVLEGLELPGDAILPEGEYALEALARHCAFLWEFKCIPDSFKPIWNSTKPRSSRQSGASSSDQQSTNFTIAPPSKIPRCWRGSKSIDTCSRLLTVAVVLGLEDVLKEEILVAVWGTKMTIKTSAPLGNDIKG